MADDQMPGWVTADDVARRAGVSRSTVSRTFTPGACVGEKTRARVIAAADELGYRVNILARSVIQQQSNLVGVVVSGFDSPFLPGLLAEIVATLEKRHLAPLLMDSGPFGDFDVSLGHLLSYRVAGVILTSGTPPGEIVHEYARLRVPVALINRESEFDGVDAVSSDNRRGGALAAECLIRSGARRLAFVNRPTRTFSGRERGAGFSEAIALSGIAGIRMELVDAAGVDHAAGAAVARELLGRPRDQRPDGVFLATDHLAIGFLDVARHAFGLRVPEDVAVVGFDDVPMAASLGVSLTTIRQDTRALAETAVAQLIGRIADPALPSRTALLPVRLIERGSTRAAPAP